MSLTPGLNLLPFIPQDGPTGENPHLDLPFLLTEDCTVVWTTTGVIAFNLSLWDADGTFITWWTSSPPAAGDPIDRTQTRERRRIRAVRQD
ncbi:hypothetical protein PAPYR_11637 [Paratrimastix pyriformis]|uniref:Uncharacterized protein n=1 Tax=Paratrimastix pyriformis TaxID=342808 RepID=A0ABQ8U5U6_9EUKA|nr:hypothetical protein PAPYR_11637 [Paratrimastix pyriformis]